MQACSYCLYYPPLRGMEPVDGKCFKGLKLSAHRGGKNNAKCFNPT